MLELKRKSLLQSYLTAIVLLERTKENANGIWHSSYDAIYTRIGKEISEQYEMRLANAPETIILHKLYIRLSKLYAYYQPASVIQDYVLLLDKIDMPAPSGKVYEEIESIK